MVDENLTGEPLSIAALENVIDEVITLLGHPLPTEYLQLLRRHNGSEGFAGADYVILWKAEELVHFNREYEVDQYAPGIFLFGSNGGGEAYGFDTQDTSMPVVRVPFVGMDRRYAEPVATSSTDLYPPGELIMVAGGATTAADRPRGMELFEIQPLMLGGDPVDPANKTWLTREQHFEFVRFWNKLISDIRTQQQPR
jgi:hypothetical protein